MNFTVYFGRLRLKRGVSEFGPSKYDIDFENNEIFEMPDLSYFSDINIISPKDDEVLNDKDPLFSWEPYPGANYYYVVISVSIDNPKELYGTESRTVKINYRIRKKSIRYHEIKATVSDEVKQMGITESKLVSGYSYGFYIRAHRKDGTELSNFCIRFKIE